jgi:hypothetical protein
MTDGLILDGPSENLGVFDCPNCKETINTSADVCRFCGTRINHEAAQRAARLLASVDQACSDASVLRYTALPALLLPLGTLIGLARNPRFIQHVGLRNVFFGFCVLVVTVSSPFPIWSLRWWRRNANLTSEDEDLQKARGIVRTTGFAAIAALVVFGLLLCVVLFVRTS